MTVVGFLFWVMVGGFAVVRLNIQESLALVDEGVRYHAPTVLRVPLVLDDRRRDLRRTINLPAAGHVGC